MKKVFYACMVALLCLTEGYAVEHDALQKETTQNLFATRGDITVLEATEKLRFLSQKIVTMYLFMFKSPQPQEVRTELKALLVELGNNLDTIAATTKDKDTKDILEFLAYSKDQIAQILTKSLNSENAALMLDYSETLLEGADSIAAAHTYRFTEEEKMLMAAKQMEYLLERMMKYYMALHTGFDNCTNRKQMHEAVTLFDTQLRKIKRYHYAGKFKDTKERVLEGWQVNDGFLKKSNTLFIPKLMMLSTDYLEHQIMKIALYHSKNQ